MAPVPAAFPAALQAVSTASLVAITLFCCVPPLHKPVRKFVRPWVVFHVRRGFSWVRFFQRKQSALVTFLSSISSMSVSVPFYVTFLSTLCVVRASCRQTDLPAFPLPRAGRTYNFPGLCSRTLRSMKTVKPAGWDRGCRLQIHLPYGMVSVCGKCSEGSDLCAKAHPCKG